MYVWISTKYTPYRGYRQVIHFMCMCGFQHTIHLTKLCLVPYTLCVCVDFNVISTLVRNGYRYTLCVCVDFNNHALCVSRDVYHTLYVYVWISTTPLKNRKIEYIIHFMCMCGFQQMKSKDNVYELYIIHFMCMCGFQQGLWSVVLNDTIIHFMCMCGFQQQ